MEPSSATRQTRTGGLVTRLETVLGKVSHSQETSEPSRTVAAEYHNALLSEQDPLIQPDIPQEGPTTQESCTMHASVGSSELIDADDSARGDRAHAYVVKYSLDIEHSQWPKRQCPPTERVSKSIRMRVRYTCHKCKTSFGHERECNGCRHRRCARCDRYPPRKPRPTAESHAPTAPSVAPVEETVPEASDATPADHVCVCHECQTIIEIEVGECPICKHQICDRCHKEARLQSDDAQDTEMVEKQEEERKAPPEEQKLPPDITPKEPPVESR